MLHFWIMSDVKNALQRKTIYLSMRLTPTAKRLLVTLAEAQGLSHAGLVEWLVRQEARRQGVK